MKNTKSIYLAGPFFNDRQKHYEEQVAYALHNNTTVGNVFRPSQLEFQENFGSKEWKSAVFETDITAINNSDIVVMIANFHDVNNEIISDSGTVFELGYARGTGKPIALVYFDNEKDPKDKILNVMIDMGAQVHITGNVDSVMKELTSFDFNNIIVNRKDWKTT